MVLDIPNNPVRRPQIHCAVRYGRFLAVSLLLYLGGGLRRNPQYAPAYRPFIGKTLVRRS